VETEEFWSCTDNDDTKYSLDYGIDLLISADTIVFHNGVMFDAPAIKKLYGVDLSDKVYDTLLVSRLIYTNLFEKDLAKKQRKVEGKLLGSHSLKAWGKRLGNFKDEIETDWSTWTPEMQEYCEQDVQVTLTLYKMLQNHSYSEEAIKLEHDFARIIQRQIARGFSFDKKKAEKLYIELLERRNVLHEELREVFGTWYEKKADKIPKRTANYKDPLRPSVIKDVPYSEVKHFQFNPASTQQIERRLKEVYGWEPTEFTPSGLAKLDAETFENMEGIDEAPLLGEYFTLNKLIGYIAEGNQAWLKVFNEDTGAIHGDVITNGAVTGRCTHSRPNVAAVPSTAKPYGKECRELFKAREGYKLVGTDASGLELRVLAHYMGDPKYVETVVNGNQEDGTDVHTMNQKAAGLPTRAKAKTFIYGFLYGAGDAKIGQIVGKGAKEGKALKAKFLRNLPKLKKLLAGVKEASGRRGYVYGLDSRKIITRSSHSSPNALLQGAGAVIMKKALVILDESLKREGFVAGEDYEFLANIHDEWQAEVKEEILERYIELSNDSIRLAGEYFNLDCPMAGETGVGSNWASTH
jgi:DNA polymerase I-like protein with 3'-5' exonuclease and polymerase domains